MAAQYYYFVSTLTALVLGEAPHLDSASFLDLLAYHVTDEEATHLQSLARTPPVSAFCPAARRWNEIDIYLRNHVLRNRRDVDRRRVAEWTREEREVFPGLDPQIDDALNAPNPLQREWRLDRIRWQILEEARFARPFAVDALAVYRLQLLLVEKWAAVDAAAGLQHIRDIADKLRPHEQLEAVGLQ